MSDAQWPDAACTLFESVESQLMRLSRHLSSNAFQRMMRDFCSQSRGSFQQVA